jgi:hydrogenase expression/formation protein HypD
MNSTGINGKVPPQPISSLPITPRHPPPRNPGRAFAEWDAEQRWQLRYVAVDDHKACACPEILRGVKRPTDCKIFGTACTPENPVGSCMVSPEGSCAAYYMYGRFRDVKQSA